MFQIKTSELKSVIRRLRAAHKPLLLIGTYGIGKSEMIFQDAKEESAETNRIFLDWNRSSLAEKQEAMLHPEKYYMFVDIRISQLDEGDLRGIPVIANIQAQDKDAELKLVTLGWINYITKPGAAGTVFFNEINLARPSVTATAYSIINDKVISDRAISPDVFIVAAGNKEEDCDLVQPIAAPLMDRFAAAELIFDSKFWLDWAASNINPHLYAFCNWKKDMLHVPAKAGTDDKAITPRGIYNASCLLNNTDFKNKNDVYSSVALCLGPAYATQFRAYYDHVRALNWDTLSQNPESVEDMDTDKKFAVMGAAVARIKDSCSQESSNVGDLIEDCALPLTVISYLSADFVMCVLKQLKDVIPVYNDKAKAAEEKLKINMGNILAKLYLLGPKNFSGFKSFRKPVIDEMTKLQKLFKDRHSKVFTTALTCK